MGRESDTTLRHDGRVLQGRVVLESDTLIFRGDASITLKLAEARRVEANGEWLDLQMPRGLYTFELGKNAAAWAEKIKNPKALVEKLGVVATSKVVVFGALDAELRAELVSTGADVAKTTRGKNKDVAFLAASKPKDLEKLEAARAAIHDHGAIWVVFPKGVESLRERDVLIAGRSLQLTDQKVAKIDEVLTAVRFCVPADRRAKR